MLLRVLVPTDGGHISDAETWKRIFGFFCVDLARRSWGHNRRHIEDITFIRTQTRGRGRSDRSGSRAGAHTR